MRASTQRSQSFLGQYLKREHERREKEYVEQIARLETLNERLEAEVAALRNELSLRRKPLPETPLQQLRQQLGITPIQAAIVLYLYNHPSIARRMDIETAVYGAKKARTLNPETKTIYIYRRRINACHSDAIQLVRLKGFSLSPEFRAKVQSIIEKPNETP